MRKRYLTNKYRTKRERRVRYCFLRQIGFSRETARKLEGFRDDRLVYFLEWLNHLYNKGVFNENNRI